MNRVLRFLGLLRWMSVAGIVLVAFTSCVLAPASDNKPSIATRSVAVFVAGSVVVTGVRFGSPSPGRSVLVHETSGTEVRIPSTDALIISWFDQGITFRLRDSATSGTLVVETPSGRSQAVALDVFRYDTYPVPVSVGTNASPLAVAVDAAGRAWLNQEFHLDSVPLAVLESGAAALKLVSAPTPPGPGPFATRIGGGEKRTHITELGEDIVVDPRGRIWVSEGGGLLYNGPLPNHSRVLGYDPAAPPGDRIRIYNLPGDHNEVTGLAWDAARNRLWLAQASVKVGPSLLSFDPEKTPFDNSFDFSQPLDSLVHSRTDPAATGYRIYPLPGARAAYPTHLLVETDGSVWFAAYLGNAIGRLDVASGEVVLLPLPKPTSANPAARSFGTVGPWDMLGVPGGGLAFNSQFENTLSRLDGSRMGNLTSCLRLDRTGQNPCLRTVPVPGADLTHQLVHSAAFDSMGRLWFSQHGSSSSAGSSASIGYVDRSWSFVVMLPSLPGQPGDSAASAANDGLAIDARTGDIWFAEYYNHRISRLHPV